MNRTTLANIVKKLTELSQEDKKNLLKLLEEVNDGGGSSPGANKAVSFEPQELTEEQQMQARKNQGLYYSGSELIQNEETITPYEDFIAEWTFLFRAHEDEADRDDFWYLANVNGYSKDKLIGGSLTYNPNFRREDDSIPHDINFDPSVNVGTIPITEDMIFPLEATGGVAYGVGPSINELYLIIVEGVYDDDAQDFGGYVNVTYKGFTEEMVKGTYCYESSLLTPLLTSFSYTETKEVIHKIDSKYTESIPSIILEYIDDEDVSVQKNIGKIYLGMSTSPLHTTLKLSTGELIDEIDVTPISTSAMDAEYHASIFPSGDGEIIISPAEYDGSHSHIIDTYLLTYPYRIESVDGKYVQASFYIVIDSERMI